MTEVKYPKVTVELSGSDGNAVMLLGKVAKALKRAEVPLEIVAKFKVEAMSGNYDHLLQTCEEWVNVE